MSDFIISCCSTIDLSDEYAKKRGIEYVNFHIMLGETEYPDDMWKTLTPQEMYKRMLDGEMSKTSQVSVMEYTEHFKKFLDQGKDILHLTLSSGISGTINSANLAADQLRDEYPDRKIYVEDSFAASSGFGLLVDKLCDLRDEGKTIDEVHDFVISERLRLQHWFFSTDLTFYIRGGRVSKASGFVGNLLNICPLLNVDYLGRLIPREKIRSKKKVIKRIVEKMEEHAENGFDYSEKVFISNSDCLEDARQVAALIEEKFPRMKGNVEIWPIGATIGAHTGPGTVALFFWGDKRAD